MRTAAYCLALVVLAGTAWLVIHALATVRTVSFSVAAALLLAALMSPMARAMCSRGAPQWLASLATLLALLAGLAGSVFLVVLRANSQVGDLQRAVNQGVGRLQKIFLRPPFSLSHQRVHQAEQQIVDAVQHALPSAMSGASMALQFLSGAVLVVFLLFFLLKDGAAMWAWVVGWAPPLHRDRVEEAGSHAWRALTSYVRGTVVVAFVDAIGIGLGMLVLGNPLTASLTLVTFIGAFVPIVGATVSGVLAVGVTLVTVGPWAALILVGVVLAVQQLEGNLLQPLIMGHALRLNPVAIVLSVSVGVVVGGILGAIIAVPFVAVVYRVVSYLAGREGAPGEGRQEAAAAHGPES